MQAYRIHGKNGVQFEDTEPQETCTYDIVDLKLPEGLRTIKEYAFADCIGLAYLHLPASLETIEDAALYLTYKAEQYLVKGK